MSAEDALRAAIDTKIAEHSTLVAEYRETFPDVAIAKQWLDHQVSESKEVADQDQELAEELGLVDMFGEISDEDFDVEAFLTDDIECDDGDVELIG